MASFRRLPGRDRDGSLRLAAERGRVLVEVSPELVVVVDGDERVIAASERAREELGAREGVELAEEQHVVDELANLVDLDTGLLDELTNGGARQLRSLEQREETCDRRPQLV